MSSANESSDFAEVTLTESDAETAGTGAGNAPAGRQRVLRVEITAADLKMFSAITGHAPAHEERERALHWADGDAIPQNHDGSDDASASSPTLTLQTGPSLRLLRPAALSMRIRDIWFNGIHLRVNKPQFSGWFRRLSLAIHQGRQRVRKAG